MTYEGLRLKVLKLKRKSLAKYNRKFINNSKFTIISNNCWGGMVYESYGLEKQSPTVGLFFAASDYLKFISNLKKYLNAPLNFINPKESRWISLEQVSSDERFGSYPVGVLDIGNESVELFFLHYKSEQNAKEKWERRVKRINWNCMLMKFNDQNGCSQKDVKKFLNLPYQNKVFFTCKKWDDIGNSDSVITIKQFPKSDSIRASFEPFGKIKEFDLNRLINNL